MQSRCQGIADNTFLKKKLQHVLFQHPKLYCFFKVKASKFAKHYKG